MVALLEMTTMRTKEGRRRGPRAWFLSFARLCLASSPGELRS